jgi:hypothetical protein
MLELGFSVGVYDGVEVSVEDFFDVGGLIAGAGVFD